MRIWKEGREKKSLRVNARKTKVMWCRVCMDQTEDSGSIHVEGSWMQLNPMCGVS